MLPYAVYIRTLKRYIVRNSLTSSPLPPGRKSVRARSQIQRYYVENEFEFVGCYRVPYDVRFGNENPSSCLHSSNRCMGGCCDHSGPCVSPKETSVGLLLNYSFRYPAMSMKTQSASCSAVYTSINPPRHPSNAMRHSTDPSLA